DLQSQLEDWQDKADVEAAELQACDASFGVCQSQMRDMSQQLDDLRAAGSNCTGNLVSVSNQLVDCQRDKTLAQQALTQANRELQSCEGVSQAAPAGGRRLARI
ncbi:hypothetical protein ABPG77_004075, partial [Micractinium sp. CCAP 211/92]